MKAIVIAMGLVTMMLPSECTVRTYTLLLVRSRNSNGTWATIFVGETDSRDVWTPSI